MLDSIKLANYRYESLKLIVLLIFSFPLLSVSPVRYLTSNLFGHFSEPIAGILASATTTVFIWLFCLFNCGFRKFLDFLSGAFLLAFTTVLLGAVVRKILPSGVFGELDHGAARLIKLYFNILMVVPFSLLALSSFSARKIIDRVSASRGVTREIGLHLALTLRVFQHVGEVIQRLLLIWKEEHPAMIFPRSHHDLGGLSTPFLWFRWVYQSVSMWIFACIILTFEPIPVMVQEIEQVYHDGEKDDR